MGIVASAPALTIWDATMTGLRRVRSSQTPAGSPTRIAGAKRSAPSRPISSAVAWSVTAAAIGSASSVNWLPSRETLWPSQNLRNSRLRPRALGGTELVS